MNRYYKTLKDLVSPVVTNEQMEDLMLGKPLVISSQQLVNRIYHNYFEETSIIITDSLINTLFCTYIFPKYQDMAITYIDREDDVIPTDFNEQYQSFLSKLLYRINVTKDEYEKLIDLYDDIKDNLLDSIKSQTKFNDTPQTVTTAGVTSYDDTYNSTVTTSYTDGASKIARLKEIETYIRDYMEDWANRVMKGVCFYE